MSKIIKVGRSIVFSSSLLSAGIIWLIVIDCFGRLRWARFSMLIKQFLAGIARLSFLVERPLTGFSDSLSLIVEATVNDRRSRRFSLYSFRPGVCLTQANHSG